MPLGSDCDVDVHTKSVAVEDEDQAWSREEDDHARELSEWRQLREEQDRAYAECLQFDQRKHAVVARREEVFLN